MRTFVPFLGKRQVKTCPGAQILASVNRLTVLDTCFYFRMIAFLFFLKLIELGDNKNVKRGKENMI